MRGAYLEPVMPRRIKPDAIRQAQRFHRSALELTPDEEWRLEMKADAERDEAAEQQEWERESEDCGDA